MVPPEQVAITDEDSAAAHVSSLLSEEPPEDGSSEPKEETSQVPSDEKPAEEAASEAADDAEVDDSQDPPDDEGDELPDTLAGLAEALEIDPNDLADYIKMPIKVNGDLREVPLSEVMKGYRLESDATQKTMKVAEREREIEARLQQMTERWQQESQRLQSIIQEAESLTDDGLDLERLLEEDPVEYQKVLLKRERRQEKLDRAREESERLQEQQVLQMAEHAKKVRSEESQKLKEALNLDKPEKLSAFEQSLTGYLQDQGYTSQQITEWFNSPYDHRHLVMMEKARKYDALQKGTKKLPKKLQGLPKVVRPGTQVKQTGQDKLLASKDRLKRLRTKGTKAQQTQAAVERVKQIL